MNLGWKVLSFFKSSTDNKLLRIVESQRGHFQAWGAFNWVSQGKTEKQSVGSARERMIYEGTCYWRGNGNGHVTSSEGMKSTREEVCITGLPTNAPKNAIYDPRYRLCKDIMVEGLCPLVKCWKLRSSRLTHCFNDLISVTIQKSFTGVLKVFLIKVV